MANTEKLNSSFMVSSHNLAIMHVSGRKRKEVQYDGGKAGMSRATYAVEKLVVVPQQA
jgi:hypothetical protein